MSFGTILSDFGLFLDLLGALLIFIFGIAPAISRDGSIFLSTGESASEKAKADSYDFNSKMGIASLFAGFGFQIISNHVNTRRHINELLIWAVMLLLLCCVYAMVWLLNIWLVRRVTFTGQYFPQYKEGSNHYEHLWVFKIKNGTKNEVEADLHLPQQVTRIDIMQPGKKMRSIESASEATIKSIAPLNNTFVRVWNMAAIASVALDTYLVIQDRTLHPKIIETIEHI